MKTLQEFADALTEAQKARKLTARELADSVGLSDLSVRKILSGQTAPRLTNAMALASELGFELVLVPKEVDRPHLQIIVSGLHGLPQRCRYPAVPVQVPR